MHSLRSRTRLSSSSPQSPDASVQECEIFELQNSRFPDAPAPRLLILRVLGLAISGISLLLLIAVSTFRPHRVQDTEPQVLITRNISVTHPPPPPVPTIYRDFLAHLSTKPEKAKNPWPPRVTRIPITDKKFLIPGYIGEQESKARIHFQDIQQLARTLDRILVLPNVGQSRLGMCRDYAFDAYYDTNDLQDVMTMDDFRWLAEDEDRLNAQLVLVGRNPKEYFPPCIPNFDVLSSTIRVGKDNLTSVLAEQSADVLIVNWDLRYPIFSTSSPLHYSPELHRLSETVAPPKSYVMVHWRMETVAASALVPCAHALLDAIHDSGISTVWFASDYPLSLRENNVLTAKSSTFRSFGEAHTRAVEVLMAEPGLDVRHIEGALSTGDMDTGVLGILDKLVGIKADVFISGAEGCGRKSSFTRQIVEGRNAAWATQNHMLNVVDYFEYNTPT